MFHKIKIILIFFTLVNKSFSIDEVYYIDYDETSDKPHNEANESVARRTLASDNLYNQHNISATEDTITDFKNYNEDDKIENNIILSYNMARKMPRLYKSVIGKDIPKVLQSSNDSTISTEKSTQKLKVPNTTFSFNLESFEEYDYKITDTYDDDLKSLRIQTTDEKLQNSQNKTETDTPYAKFYNLEPAVNQDLHFNNETKYIQSRAWYVPQDFPCWDLPVLYGELGAKKKKYNVFLIYGGNLVNVIESSAEKEFTHKSVELPMAHIINKWCEVEPCYGDHTLCLFPRSGISNICDKEYKIHTPSILDQFALVNTINTMRNHIANGVSKKYPHLPTAANMKQITYDYDLEDMAEAWLRQCLPGPAPCSALDGNLVSHLECTKYAKYCCSHDTKRISECNPRSECYVYPIIGCIHVWFSSAGQDLTERDVHCGRSSASTFHTVQLLWAKTSKIGCAYGERPNGDIRVVCNFSPGAPFYLETKLYCGIIAHRDIAYFRNNVNVTDLAYLASLGIKWRSIFKSSSEKVSSTSTAVTMLAKNIVSESIGRTEPHWGVDSLTKLYEEGWVRKQLGDRKNGTRSMVARLVAKYTFIDETESRCDSDESIYVAGDPGSLCVEKGRTYHGLCYDFRDPTPGYRLIAIAAPIALFSLILYDLFSGVVRQTNN